MSHIADLEVLLDRSDPLTKDLDRIMREAALDALDDGNRTCIYVGVIAWEEMLSLVAKIDLVSRARYGYTESACW